MRFSLERELHKTRYIFHIQKCFVRPESRGRPFEANRKIPPERLRVPLNQMIFVGDGYTDIPCFSLIRKNDGIAIGSTTPPTASAGAEPEASSKTAGSPTWCLPTTAATRR